MKFKLNLKEKVTEAAEHVYDVVKREDYAIRIHQKVSKLHNCVKQKIRSNGVQRIIDCEKALSKTAQ